MFGWACGAAEAISCCLWWPHRSSAGLLRCTLSDLCAAFRTALDPWWCTLGSLSLHRWHFIILSLGWLAQPTCPLRRERLRLHVRSCRGSSLHPITEGLTCCRRSRGHGRGLSFTSTNLTCGLNRGATCRRLCRFFFLVLAYLKRDQEHGLLIIIFSHLAVVLVILFMLKQCDPLLICVQTAIQNNELRNGDTTNILFKSLSLANESNSLIWNLRAQRNRHSSLAPRQVLNIELSLAKLEHDVNVLLGYTGLLGLQSDVINSNLDMIFYGQKIRKVSEKKSERVKKKKDVGESLWK